jgi:hypothetical protein
MFFRLWRMPLYRESFSDAQNKMLEQLSLKTIWNLLQVNFFFKFNNRACSSGSGGCHSIGRASLVHKIKCSSSSNLQQYGTRLQVGC